MGNSSTKKIDQSGRLNISENFHLENVIKCLLTNYPDIIDIDCVYFDTKKYIISVLTKEKIIFGILIIKHKKQKKLDIKIISEIYEAEGRNILIHQKRKNIIAIQFDTHINIYQIDIGQKSHKLLNLLQFGLNELHFIRQNMYFTHDNQIIYTSLDGNIFIYDFIKKKLLNKIDLSVINRFQQINGIDYGLDLNTNECFAAISKRTYSKDTPIDPELIYVLNITNFERMSRTGANQISILQQQLLYFNSEKLMFELCFNKNNETKTNEHRLKLFKQIECLSISPNMEFLAVVCGSSIDFFSYQRYLHLNNNSNDNKFIYIKYHNYGAQIKNICWIDNNVLVVSDKQSSSLVITQIEANSNVNKYYCINNIIKELTTEIIDVICGFLQEWKIFHKSIKINCDGLKAKGSVLKILMTCL